VFFPPYEDDTRDEMWEAKRICMGCPVMEQCYEAHRLELYGIFGGTSGPDRRRIRRWRGTTVEEVWATARERFEEEAA
jgi:hypothetical protein